MQSKNNEDDEENDDFVVETKYIKDIYMKVHYTFAYMELVIALKALH
jgi:hypothetical protein